VSTRLQFGDGFNPYYRGLKTIVTGGLGFIGSNLARRLVSLGAAVQIVDSLQRNSAANLFNIDPVKDKLHVRQVDLIDSAEMEEIFSGCRVVFNLAGQVSHVDSMLDPVADARANIHAQLALLEACRRYAPQARIVFASTRQIYGRPVCWPVSETHPLRPVDVNGINKMAAEAYHSLYHHVHGLRTVSLRLTNTYGPCMRIKDARQTFVGLWLRKCIEDGVFEVWGGEQKRDLTYVDDVVQAFLLAACVPETEGQVFNIGGSPPITLFELAELLVSVAGTGRFEMKEFPPERFRIDIGDYFADDSSFRTLTGWSPQVTLREGLMRTVAYYRSCLEEYV
jgi:nucleoside-diphosphate-sugar epimerase